MDKREHRQMQDHSNAMDIVGATVATSLVAAPAWYEHALAYVPAPTALYGILGSIFLLVQIADKFGLLPDFTTRRKRRRDDDAQNEPD